MAVIDAEKSAALDPTDPFMFASKAYVYNFMGRPAEAAEIVSGVKRLNLSSACPKKVNLLI